MLSAIARFIFKRPRPPTVPPRIWNAWEHRGWGNRIEFLIWERRRISAHLPNRYLFRVGDELRERMVGGKIGRFRVVKVEYCQQPDDMFFATVKDIGYLEEEQRGI